MKITAVIPAKGHSERVRNKNLQEISGKSLVQRACEKMLSCENVDEVYLDTEDERIKSTVRPLFNQGLKLIDRPPQLANNDIGGNEMFVYALHSVNETDVLVQHSCASPLIKSETIDSAINQFINKKDEYDSFLTVTPVKEYFWNNKNEPENFGLDTLPNSQDLDKLYSETDGLYGIKTDELIRQKRRIGENPLLVSVPKIESFDIDTQEDLEMVRRLADFE
jgi:CMP-N-acetylneuraminic acid synthetase